MHWNLSASTPKIVAWVRRCRTCRSPLIETFGALSALRHHGSIRYIGSFSYSGSQIVEAQITSRDHNLVRFVTGQPLYSMLV